MNLGKGSEGVEKHKFPVFPVGRICITSMTQAENSDRFEDERRCGQRCRRSGKQDAFEYRFQKNSRAFLF